VSFAQTTPNYAAPCAEFERRVHNRTIKHTGCPILAWQVGNLRWRLDTNGNRRPDKSKAAKKIDAVVAAIMAMAQEMMNPAYRGGIAFI
jgi:phage terminase large subunit-like protein